MAAAGPLLVLAACSSDSSSSATTDSSGPDSTADNAAGTTATAGATTAGATAGKLTQAGDGVVLLTDGVADDLEADHLAEFFEALYQDLSIRNRRRGRRWIQSELEDWATPMHSDDKTLVAVFRTSK